MGDIEEPDALNSLLSKNDSKDNNVFLVRRRHFEKKENAYRRLLEDGEDARSNFSHYQKLKSSIGKGIESVRKTFSSSKVHPISRQYNRLDEEEDILPEISPKKSIFGRIKDRITIGKKGQLYQVLGDDEEYLNNGFEMPEIQNDTLEDLPQNPHPQQSTNYGEYGYYTGTRTLEAGYYSNLLNVLTGQYGSSGARSIGQRLFGNSLESTSTVDFMLGIREASMAGVQFGGSFGRTLNLASKLESRLIGTGGFKSILALTALEVEFDVLGDFIIHKYQKDPVLMDDEEAGFHFGMGALSVAAFAYLSPIAAAIAGGFEFYDAFDWLFKGPKDKKLLKQHQEEVEEEYDEHLRKVNIMNMKRRYLMENYPKDRNISENNINLSESSNKPSLRENVVSKTPLSIEYSSTKGKEDKENNVLDRY